MKGFVYHPETEFDDYDLVTVGEDENISPPGWECMDCGRMFQARLLGVTKQPPDEHFCWAPVPSFTVG